MRISKDLTVLTPGEALWVRRKAAGKTQAEAAVAYGLGENAYLDVEKDRRPAPRRAPRGIPPVSTPSLPLLLALARRRSGKGLDWVADRTGVSRVTVVARERAGSAELRAFWERWGWSFGRLPVAAARIGR